MLLIFLFISSTIASYQQIRVRRQYNWNESPYYNGGNYWQISQSQWYPQQYNNRAEYIEPYYSGVQHQYGFYNAPSQYWPQQPQQNPPNGGGYLTGPPKYLPTKGSGYSRPTYLATMQPKPKAPVVLERATVLATNPPPITNSLPPIAENGRPKVLERVVGTVAPLPSTTMNIDGFFEKDVSPSSPGTQERNETLGGQDLETESLIETTSITEEAPTEPSQSIPTKLIATQEIGDAPPDADYDLNKLSTEDPIEEGSGNEDGAVNSTTTLNNGIVGLRTPPLPNQGIEVVKWSDSDRFVKKLLS